MMRMRGHVLHLVFLAGVALAPWTAAYTDEEYGPAGDEYDSYGSPGDNVAEWLMQHIDGFVDCDGLTFDKVSSTQARNSLTDRPCSAWKGCRSRGIDGTLLLQWLACLSCQACAQQGTATMRTAGNSHKCQALHTMWCSSVV
jgi:hypothetical protein